MTPRLLEGEETRESLARFIAAASGCPSARLARVEPLRGGAIQENWAIDVELPRGATIRQMALVLRTDAATRVAASHGRAEEFALLKAAFAAGVTVPEPLWLCTDRSVLGRDFYLMRRMAGVATGHRKIGRAHV